MTEKDTINFEDLTDEEFQNLSEEDLNKVTFPADLFYNEAIAKRAEQINKDLENEKGVVIIKGDPPFKGFDD